MKDPLLHERSDEFESTLAAILGPAWCTTQPTNPRYRVSASAARLSTEHARAARLLLLECIAPQSGAALLRLQFEALLRAIWTLYCATDDQVRKLTAVLGLDSEQAAKGLPGPLDMLHSIIPATPEGLHSPLKEFHASSWRALNSYVHAGIHPLARETGGFPIDFAENLVRVSNGLMHLAYRFQASFLGQEHVNAVTREWPHFRDVLPAIILGHDQT